MIVDSLVTQLELILALVICFRKIFCFLTSPEVLCSDFLGWHNSSSFFGSGHICNILEKELEQMYRGLDAENASPKQLANCATT